MKLLKETAYDKLVSKINNIDRSRFVLKTKYNTDKSDLEKKVPDTSGLDQKQIIMLKLPKQKKKSKEKQTDFDTKISDAEKNINTTEYNKFTKI